MFWNDSILNCYYTILERWKQYCYKNRIKMWNSHIRISLMISILSLFCCYVQIITVIDKTVSGSFSWYCIPDLCWKSCISIQQTDLKSLPIYSSLVHNMHIHWRCNLMHAWLNEVSSVETVIRDGHYLFWGFHLFVPFELN
jgi:hypothetical protein